MKHDSLSKYLALSFLLLLVVSVLPTSNSWTMVSSQPSENYANASFAPKSILFDESHCDNGSSLWAPGNASLFSWILGESGYDSDTNFNTSLDSGVLDQYDILVLFFPVIPLTSGEIDAIHAFVDAGGGLLLVGVDNSNFWEFRSNYLNPISSGYGITFQSNTVDETVTSFATHNITYGVTSITTRGDDLKFCMMSVSTPAVSVVNSTSGSIIATSESGSGRVVGVGGPSIFYMYRKNAGGFGESHFQMSVNIIDWLAGNPKRIVNIPSEAVITVGPGPSLSPSEVEQYNMFTGAYHDHTTDSDGANTPLEMLEKGIRLGYDFFVMSDHSHNTPGAIGGITGAIHMQEIVNANNIDLPIIVGAELSSVKHTVGFPLTENIWTDNQQYAVDQIHAQGGIAILAHPTIGFDYAPVYKNRTAMGYDAIEVDNRGFFFGGGEDGFFDNFMGSADTHTDLEDGLRDAIFVENPSGPNGRVTAGDIVDAVLNKRVVIIDPYNGMIYGQEVWVNRYLEIRDQAESAIQSCNTLLDSLRDSGEEVGLSEFYLADAMKSLDALNPDRALRMVQNATSDAVLGIDLAITSPVVMEPNTDHEVPLVLKNNHTYGVEIASTLFVGKGITVTSNDFSFVSAGKSTSTVTREFLANSYGLVAYYLNLYEFNTTGFINPILIPMKGIIDNVTVEAVKEGGDYNADVAFWIGRASARQIVTATLFYDDGTGEQQVDMNREYNLFLYTLGPFPANTELSIHIVVVTFERNTYTIGEQVLTLNATAPPPEFGPILILAAVGGAAAIILIIVVVFLKRRGR